MEIDQLKNVIEAVLLAAGRPLGVDQLIAVFAEYEKPERSEIDNAVSALQADYESRGIALIQVGSGYRIQVRETMQPWVAQLWEEKPTRYSRALLETLALIAYRQPVTRAEIEAIRGVGSEEMLRQLLERDLVAVGGRAEDLGRPNVYVTTRRFLAVFGLSCLEDLPKIEGFSAAVLPDSEADGQPDGDAGGPGG